MVTPAAIDSTSAPSGSTSAQAVERGDRVGRLHRHHEHLGVGRRPRRARHDPDAREAALERVAAIGVDLGDRERLGLAAGVEQADDEGLAHAPAAEQRQLHPAQG